MLTDRCFFMSPYCFRIFVIFLVFCTCSRINQAYILPIHVSSVHQCRRFSIQYNAVVHSDVYAIRRKYDGNRITSLKDQFHPHGQLSLRQNQRPNLIRLQNSWTNVDTDPTIGPSSSQVNTPSDESSDGWTAGNFTHDLLELQRSYNFSCADEQLRASQRIHILNAFAQQRRDLHEDLRHFVYPPLRVLSIILLSRIFLNNFRRLLFVERIDCIFQGLLELGFSVMNVSFWIFSVFPPLVLTWKKYTLDSSSRRKCMKQEDRLFNPNDDDFSSLISLSIREEGDIHPCSDYIACLLNQWNSSILGIIFLSLAVTFLPMYQTLVVPSSFTLSFYLLTLQLVTRMGAFMSIHQFPGLLYQLRRDNQPRPLPYMITKMQHCIERMIHILPWGLALDSLQLALIFLEKRGILLQSSSFLAYQSCLNTISTLPTSNISPCILRIVSLLCMRHPDMLLPKTRVVHGSWKLQLFITILTMGPSLAHIVTFLRIWKVQRFSNISLATKLDDLKDLLQKNNDRNLEDTLGLRWRYKLEWREPQTLSQSIQSIWKKFVIFMLSGWDGTALDSTSFQYDPKNPSTRSRDTSQPLPKILSLVDEDRARNPDAPIPDRNTWVETAMEKMSAIHEENYKRKSFEDPLGIAVQKTFGIGLSFDFDHDTPLKEGQEPSIHRLRARAAKSAIKRFQQIPQELKEKVDGIQDPDEKIQTGLQLMESARLEVREMVHALAELIPTNADSPEDKPFDIETLKQTDAKVLPASILSYDIDKKDSNSWEDAILSQYTRQYDDDMEEDKNRTNSYDGLGEGILV